MRTVALEPSWVWLRACAQFLTGGRHCKSQGAGWLLSEGTVPRVPPVPTLLGLSASLTQLLEALSPEEMMSPPLSSS